jgi:hypothetical protein
VPDETPPPAAGEPEEPEEVDDGEWPAEDSDIVLPEVPEIDGPAANNQQPIANCE